MHQFTLRLKTEGRSVARRLGVLGPLSRVKRLVSKTRGRDSYEHAFDEALRSETRAGDIVWDIGANIGLYTIAFSDAVGASGIVCAFEPAPSCHEELRRRCGGRRNVRIFNMALGERDGVLPMWLSAHPLDATHSLVPRETGVAGVPALEVRVVTGDQLIASGDAPFPDILKIDVEGFEEEVLRGLNETISNPKCRAVFCEVHFAILDGRGKRQAPARIQRFLSDRGFQVLWTDASHLASRRQ